MGTTSTVKLLLDRVGPDADEILALAVVAEKFGGDIDVILSCLHQLKERSLSPHPSYQIMAQHLLVKDIERDDLNVVIALCSAGVSLSNCRLYAKRTVEAGGWALLL